MAVRDETRTFELIGGHPALDFVNTLDWRFRDEGTEELLSSYDDLLRFVTQAELLTSKQVRQVLRSADETREAQALVSCRELRETAAEIFYAALDGRNPSNTSLRKLNAFLSDARSHQQPAWSASGLSWQWAADELNAELPLWILSLSVVELLESDELKRLSACEDPACRWLFLDTSKNHTRRWCTMKICGNRMKARRFKAQHRD